MARVEARVSLSLGEEVEGGCDDIEGDAEVVLALCKGRREVRQWKN